MSMWGWILLASAVVVAGAAAAAALRALGLP